MHIVQGVVVIVAMHVAGIGDLTAQTAKIAGLGAARCDVFTADTEQTPAMHRDYFAWAQGFMSGVLISQPPDVDDGVDLVPHSLPLVQQVEWLRQYCRANPGQDFTDAVLSLYKRLRQGESVRR